MRSYSSTVLLAGILTLSATFGCSSKSETSTPAASDEAVARFELDTDFSVAGAIFQFPYPSNLALSPTGGPFGTAFPNPLEKKLVEGLRNTAGDRAGFPVVPTAYFHFDRGIQEGSLETVIPADFSSTVLLIDVDDSSPDRGKLFPTVARVLPIDDYVPENVLGVAARPGFVLHEKRTYAFVLLRAWNDAKGKKLGVSPGLAALIRGETPTGSRGEKAKTLYAPLFKLLVEKGVSLSEVSAATVFTTGDVVADFGALSDKIVAANKVAITDLAIDPVDGATHDRFCELHGKMTLPQFQTGKPPFNTDGLFVMDSSTGLPKKQRDEIVPIVVTLPKKPMPVGGYPLMVYFHGSGGRSTQVVDRGLWHLETDPLKCPDKDLFEKSGRKGCYTAGSGPAWVVAEHGIAAAGSAHPVNPERLPGASDIEYINLGNLAAFRDTFRQGSIEQRLYIQALKDLRISPDVMKGCVGPSLPTGETTFRFREDRLMAQGQSMGGMYTNIIAAIEPRIEAITPTGAGGYWSYFMTRTQLFGDTKVIIAALAGANTDLVFMHPVLQLLQTAWEPSDPFVYMPRIAQRPLAKHPVRHVYEPVGKNDSYFPIELYDAIALSYGHKQAGDEVWPMMQKLLTLGGLGGILSYPVSLNLKSGTGTPYTGVVVQYAADDINRDGHNIYDQLTDVRYQSACFFASFVAKGTPVVPKPAAPGTACPGL